MSLRPPRRLLAWVVAPGALAGGMVVGLAAVALHLLWWGLLLAAAASLAVVWALPPQWWTLPPYAIGWWIPFLVAWQGRREGDFVIESSPYGYGLLGLAITVLAAAMVVATLKSPIRRRAPGSAPRGAR